MNIKLPAIANSHPIAFWTAVVLHALLLVGLLFSNVQKWELPKQEAKSKSADIPKAVTVDLESIEQEKQRLIQVKQQREQRLADLKRAEKKVENERYKEQQRLKRLKEQTKKAAQAKSAAEKKRQAEELKIKQAKKYKLEAEQKAKAAKKKALEAEKEAKAAKDKASKAEAEKKRLEQLRQQEATQFAKEQDTRALKKEIQAEEDQERALAQEDILNELKSNYINQIAARVKDKWRYNGAKDDWGCDVYILQDIDGNVKSVNLTSCNIDKSAKAKSFKDSIERAVYKASPLPDAPDKSVFDREVVFHFRVN